MGRHAVVVALALLASLAVRTASGQEARIGAGEDQIQQLRNELDAVKRSNAVLQQQVQQLRVVQGDTWLNERRQEEVKALVREVLADADTRASLLESQMVAGHNGKNFFLGSDNGQFLMNIKGQIQVRYLFNSRQTSSDDGENGFQIRRVKFHLYGHVIDPSWRYWVTVAGYRGDNEASIERAEIMWDVREHATLHAGRTKAPFIREELISSTHQMAVERSVWNETFTAGITEGFGVDLQPMDPVKVQLWVSDGINSGESRSDPNTSVRYAGPGADGIVGTADDRFTTTSTASNDFHLDSTDYALTARVEGVLAGDWKQSGDFTSWSNDQLAVFVGSAIHWEKGESGSAGSNGSDLLMVTADGMVKYRGFSLYAAWAGAWTNPDAAAARAAQGTVLQVAYNISDRVEPFANWVWYDGPGVGDDLDVITIGVNYFIHSHSAKLTLDVVWALDPISAAGGAIGGSGNGLLVDSDHDNQVALRAQMQLLF